MRGSELGGGGGGSTCRLSVKTQLLCRLSVKIFDLCRLWFFKNLAYWWIVLYEITTFSLKRLL